MPRDGSYSTLNYQKQGGDTWCVCGTLQIMTGGKIVPDDGTQAGAITNLTDNSGGTASATVASISDTATKNAIASIVANLNALNTACKNVGITA